MPKDIITPDTNRAISLWRDRLKGDPVAFPAMSEREFNAFLHEAFGNPMDSDEWGKPCAVEILDEDADFERIEFFQTPKGPVCAAYGKDDFRVYVAADRRLATRAGNEGSAAL